MVDEVLSMFREQAEVWLRLLDPAAPSEAADCTRWLFLDTETTGLAGGTGTYAFLVGIAWWDGSGLAVEQLFMRDHREEAPLLEELAARLAERDVLVTFNGKSFDWPLLETRFRIARRRAAAPARTHLDLLHSARQLWRMQIGSARLPELERRVLALERGRDLASELIPHRYFEYLRGGPAEPLAEVFRHNQLDLRGLAQLSARVVELLNAPESASTPLELYGLSRLLSRRGERLEARVLYERALGAGLPAALDRVARAELARLAKRERDYGRATSLWRDLLDDSRFALSACEELAIFYEHHEREPARAAELTRDAMRALGSAARSGGIPQSVERRLRSHLEHRLARLERKCGIN
jgi:uncharacterized protein YprB with RNaseH-like and TPR domain